jgi:hypothetical protein
MKLKYILTCLAAVLLSASATFAQTTLAKWTFETSQPALNGTAGHSILITNIASEIGNGTASGFHSGFGTPTFSSPAGNGSAHSFSANGWTNNPGDFFQFAVSTLAFQGISISWDQIGSATGPKNFNVFYSTDGITFTQFGSTYNVTAATWASGSTNLTTTFNFDLSSVAALNNSPVVYFRLVDASTVPISSGTAVGSAGTSRIDNFAIVAAGGTGPAVIITQPQPVNTFFGNTASLSVLASGQAPVSYQWYYPNLNTPLVDGPSGFGSGPTAGTISGSTNSTLTLVSIDPAQAGPYQVIVSNALGTATSIVAQVTVNVRTPIVTNIAYLRTLQTATWTPSDTTNLYTVIGTVTTPFNMTAATSSEFYMQDASGDGIAVFVGGGTFVPSLGDSVQVTGPLGQFDGLLELNLSVSNPSHSVTDISSGNPLPAPKFFSITSLTNIPFVETNIEGSLVILSNVFLQQPQPAGFIGGASINMTNLTGTNIMNLFVNANASDVIASPVPAFASSIAGVFSQHSTSAVPTNSYELDILQIADLVPGTPPVIVNPIPLTIQSSGGNLTLTWSDPSFSLQSSTNVAGPYTTISAAASPYTDSPTNTATFYRLVH